MIGFKGAYSPKAIHPDELKDFFKISLTQAEFSATPERFIFEEKPIELRPCTMRDVNENFY